MQNQTETFPQLFKIPHLSLNVEMNVDDRRTQCSFGQSQLWR
jgi:hypothetical protein